MNLTRKNAQLGGVLGESSVVRTARTFLKALLISVLLQTPAISQQTLPPASSATETTPNGAAKESATREVATIIQSPSTNTPGFRIVIHDDGSATEEIRDFSHNPGRAPVQPRQYPPGTIDTNTLNRLLTKIGDVSTIPTGFCPKSVSFGTRTQISYNGKTSGDLQCIRRAASGTDESLLQASEELSRFVQQIVKQAKVPVGRSGMVFK